MTVAKQENIKFYTAILGTLCLLVILPINIWGLKTIVHFTTNVFPDYVVATERRIAVLESSASVGTRYTLEMAEKDLAPIVEKVNDHELRIRTLEGN